MMLELLSCFKANTVRTLEQRKGMQAGSPEDYAYQHGWITTQELAERARLFGKNDYSQCLFRTWAE